MMDDTSLPSGIPLCVSLVFWDSLHYNELQKKNGMLVSYLTALIRLPFIQDPTTSRHHSINQAYFNWSLVCQFHNSRFTDLEPISFDSFIPVRISHGVRYAIVFSSSSQSKESSDDGAKIMDCTDIPKDALCKIWFTLTTVDMSPFVQQYHPPILTCHHIEVCTEQDALTTYLERPLSFHYRIVPPMMTAVNFVSYKTLIFSVLRYYKHHSFVIPLDLEYFGQQSSKDRSHNGLLLFDTIDAFKVHFFLPLQAYL